MPRALAMQRLSNSIPLTRSRSRRPRNGALLAFVVVGALAACAPKVTASQSSAAPEAPEDEAPGNFVIIPWVRETPHPYANSATYQVTYSAPGATTVGVHFERLATESGFDFVTIYDSQGTLVYGVSGNRIQGGQSISGAVFGRTDGWCYVAGSSMTIQLITDVTITDYGFRTDLAYAAH